MARVTYYVRLSGGGVRDPLVEDNPVLWTYLPAEYGQMDSPPMKYETLRGARAAADVARKLGHPADVVCERGITQAQAGPPRVIDPRGILRLLALGGTVAAVARKVGTTRQTVHRIRKEWEAGQ